MVINGDKLLMMSPISDMLIGKHKQFGVSHGLAEVGYDIRIKQEILFIPGKTVQLPMYEGEGLQVETVSEIYRFDGPDVSLHRGRFVLASTHEEFIMPDELVGIVHDKSTWAREGLSVFNTVIEPGWTGYLTLELAFNGSEPLHIPAGAGIAQVLFHQTSEAGRYSGKYQHQEDRPVASVYA
jgi:dCTP deaminase